MSGGENQQSRGMRIGVFFADSDRGPEERIVSGTVRRRTGGRAARLRLAVGSGSRTEGLRPAARPAHAPDFPGRHNGAHQARHGGARTSLPASGRAGEHAVVAGRAFGTEGLTLGVGVGWNEKEFEALGMSKKERGRRTDEGLEVLEQLWSGQEDRATKAASTLSRTPRSA